MIKITIPKILHSKLDFDQKVAETANFSNSIFIARKYNSLPLRQKYLNTPYKILKYNLKYKIQLKNIIFF